MIKIHLYYLFNKLIIAIILITNLMILFSLLVNDKNMYSYLDNVYPFLKIISVLISIFIYCYSMSEARDYYFYFYVGSISRVKYLFTKLICLLIINFVIILMFYLLFLFVSRMVIDEYYYFRTIHIRFITIFILSNVYGMIAFIMIMLVNNQFIMLIPFGLFILGDNLEGFSSILLNDKINSDFLIIYGIIILVIYWLIALIIYKFKDINY